MRFELSLPSDNARSLVSRGECLDRRIVAVSILYCVSLSLLDHLLPRTSYVDKVS
jgi:hypothetical protein